MDSRRRGNDGPGEQREPPARRMIAAPCRGLRLPALNHFTPGPKKTIPGGMVFLCFRNAFPDVFQESILSCVACKATFDGRSGRAGNHSGVIPAQQVGIWRTVSPVAGNAHDNGAIRITICDGVDCRGG